MGTVGIVCEYNPFHNGHKYHIEKSREITDADTVVCVMSGDYVQRGEPAVFDKWERCRAAIDNGADIVFEIPVMFCVANASVYASAAVEMLEAFGAVDYISFGSESGNIEGLVRVAGNLDKFEEELKSQIRVYAREGKNYPRAREKAYADIFGSSPYINEDIGLLGNSNDILAIEYIRSIRNIKPVTVQREGTLHDSVMKAGAQYQSATALRQRIETSENISEYVPGTTLKSISQKNTEQNFWFELIKYKILTAQIEQIENAPQGGEGLARRLKSKVITAENINDLILKTKSKRYTYTHIQRLLMQSLLDIDRDMYTDAAPEYLRLLGFSNKGAKLLKKVKKEKLNRIPIVTNVNRETENKSEKFNIQLAMDIKAADIYNLAEKKNLYNNSDFVKSPVMNEKSIDIIT